MIMSKFMKRARTLLSFRKLQNRRDVEPGRQLPYLPETAPPRLFSGLFSLVLMAMAATVHPVFSHITHFRSTRPKTPTLRYSRANSVRCFEGNSEARQVTLKNGNDSLDICRVLNGMWQTSGGWGRIDRDGAVEAMLRYADAGLSTFDMADHCKWSHGSTLSFLAQKETNAAPPKKKKTLLFTWKILIGRWCRFQEQTKDRGVMYKSATTLGTYCKNYKMWTIRWYRVERIK